MPLNPKARDTLIEMVRRHGEEIVADPRRCEGYLRDFCAAERLEMNLLIDALRERVPQSLQAHAGKKLVQAHVPDLVETLHLHRGMRQDYAYWAVEAWAAALGLTVPAPAAAQSPETPAERQFRQAAKFATQDGVVTRDERRNLDALRDKLGLAPPRAERIVAEELAAVPRPGVKPRRGRAVAVLLLAVAGIAGAVVWKRTHSAGPTTAGRQTTAVTAAAPKPPPPPPAPAGSQSSPATLPANDAVVRLADRIAAERMNVQRRAGELAAATTAAQDRRSALAASLPEFQRVDELLTRAVERAEVEDRWPVRLGEQRLSARRSRAAVQALGDAIAGQQNAIAALDDAVATARTLQDAAGTLRKELDDQKRRLAAAHDTADLTAIDHVVTTRVQAFQSMDQRAAPTLSPPLPADATVDSVFASLPPDPH